MAAQPSDEDIYDDPLAEEPLAGSEFVQALASVLTHLAKVDLPPRRWTSFHSIRAPPLTITDYLLRIAKYFQCSNECFVLCLIYIDRIVKIQPDFTICDLNIHRILATAAMLAVKFFDDVYYSNNYYAKVGGIQLKEANMLEAQFLKLLDWRLHVTTQEYVDYRTHVYSAVQGMHPSRGLVEWRPPASVTEEAEERGDVVTLAVAPTPPSATQIHGTHPQRESNILSEPMDAQMNVQ